MSGRTIVTPEHVEIHLRPAGLGSRFLALLVDLTLIMGATGLLRQVLAIVLPEWLLGAVVLTLGFVLTWGYHVFFEVLFQGRTPGKRAAGLRVVDGRGLPLGLEQSFVRNVLRALDAAPLAYGLGALACQLDPLRRRLGDVVADTLVIRESASAGLPPQLARSSAFNSLRTPRVLGLLRHRVSLEEREFLVALVLRAPELEDRARFDLMEEVASHYRRRLGVEDPNLSGERFVRGLAAVLG